MLKKKISFAVLAVLLLAASALRFWRINELLGFYYDQGRDALVIWDFIYRGKFFLIGPTTGIAGIFRGPFYYYLIAPFYWLGKGNPLYPEIFLIITSILALILMFFLAKEIGGEIAAFATLILGAFSFEIIYAGRWLSNPTPMLLFSMLIVFSLFKILEGRKKFWILLSFILGLSFFNFGSSGELFYFPAIFIFLLWQVFKKGYKKILPGGKIILYSFAAFIFSYLPLFFFNLRHGGILGGNLKSFIFGNTFGVGSAVFTFNRLIQVVSFLTSLIFHAPYEKEFLWLTALFVFILFYLSELLKNEKFKLISILLLSPVIGLLFFQGNYGNVYGYYLTGYYLIFLIFVGVSLAFIFQKSIAGKIFVILFLAFFLNKNWFWTKGMLNTQISDPVIIVLGNQKQAVNWIYQNAKGRKFNVDTYVPPVIPYAYDYLFTWIDNPDKVENQVSLLYTLYEADPDHPERLKAWLERQKGIGKIVKEQRFGGIVVQERQRIVKK